MDANVLIDLLKLGVLRGVAGLEAWKILIPEVVRAEVRRPAQAAVLDAALADGSMEEIVLESLEEQALMAEIAGVIGRADAACLAAATHRGAQLASDERRRPFLREVRRLLGEHRLVRLESLLAQAIASGLLTMEHLEGAVRALASTAMTARDHDDVSHLERVLDRVRTLLCTTE